MRLITSSDGLVMTFTDLCSRYKHYQWAGDIHAFNLAGILKKNEEKIERLVVGLHFYQTSPSFIESYMHNRHVRFLMQSDGTFHSKMYLFYNDSGDWQAIVGSSNFTDSGFNRNCEANVCFSSGKDKGISFSEMNEYLRSLWRNGEYFDKKKLDAYCETIKQQDKKLSNLRKLGNRKDSLQSRLELMTWEEYTNLVLSQDIKGIDTRLKLLQKANTLFKSTASFNSLSTEGQHALAGLASTLESDGIDWQLFGSTTAKGDFWDFVDSGELGRAIDIIPLFGDVNREQYMPTVTCFSRITKATQSRGDPLVGNKAPRLLC